MGNVEEFGIDTPKEKVEKKVNPVQYYVKFSFSITYILLLTTATITFIEAMRTNIPHVRHILNLETAISVIAGYFYSSFVERINNFEKTDTPIDWRDITATRYIDWSITTPLMLLALCVVLAKNIKLNVPFNIFAVIVVLNYAMLYLGYLGEIKAMDRTTAMLTGFVAFFGMFYLIFTNFVTPTYMWSNYVLYAFYLLIWSIYGIVYMLDEQWKNISMNILDCIAKCFIGLGLWAYYTKIIV